MAISQDSRVLMNPVEQRSRPLVNSVGCLQDIVGELDDRVQTLAGRLNPILRPSPPHGVDTRKEDSAEVVSGMTENINELVARIRSLTRMIEGMTENLDV